MGQRNGASQGHSRNGHGGAPLPSPLQLLWKFSPASDKTGFNCIWHLKKRNKKSALNGSSLHSLANSDSFSSRWLQQQGFLLILCLSIKYHLNFHLSRETDSLGLNSPKWIAKGGVNSFAVVGGVLFGCVHAPVIWDGACVVPLGTPFWHSSASTSIENRWTPLNGLLSRMNLPNPAWRCCQDSNPEPLACETGL